ncbi:MAG: hypothetical protein LAT75_01045 [Candidatus Cyclonatronum sp.]|uniref:hypothetical protein n=1 Tax=Cyclonatronum sp. TaxID=3024185 RepID=UPI0025C2EC4A|nr:hypothetical protein [Cyclonatronum sp.]MCC5933261.1 hypothetical protein [Balneolales bacterium]MCH8485418.1 hypothetical protein [Cyclonatronum sp.]
MKPLQACPTRGGSGSDTDGLFVLWQNWVYFVHLPFLIMACYLQNILTPALDFTRQPFTGRNNTFQPERMPGYSIPYSFAEGTPLHTVPAFLIKQVQSKLHAP